MKMGFADTLYFKEDNILKIILGSHRTNKLINQEIITETDKNYLTLNEFLVLIEIKKGFRKKVDLANKLFIKRQNINTIFNDLLNKKLITKNKNGEIILTDLGKNNLDISIKKISSRIMNIFKEIDPKNMGGFINIIEKI
ncbi:MarR family transcriptional regulator [Alphaproteobacteria bacterium]|nr:MarR family transcriptional regulator [Alphaproteobacteria bacterium]